MVLALINTAFAQETTEGAREQWRVVADHFRPKLPKLAQMLDEAEPDVLAFMDFPRAHRKQIASTNRQLAVSLLRDEPLLPEVRS